MKCILTILALNCAHAHISTSADFLYWMPLQNNSSYATDSKVHRPDYSWSPGVRTSLGVITNHDKWDVRGSYTWYYSSGNDKASGTLNPNWEVFSNDLGTITRAKSNWNLHYSTITTELGRMFATSDYLDIRPYIGAIATWQKQNSRISYNSYSIKSHQRFWGVGIRGGADSFWRFCKTFGLIANVAISGVAGNFNVDRKDTFNGTTPANIGSSEGSVLPLFEMALGLKWEKSYSKATVSLSALFEEQLWLDMNRIIRHLRHTSNGNLSLIGATLRARIDF